MPDAYVCMWKSVGKGRARWTTTAAHEQSVWNSEVPQWPSIASPPLLLSLPQMEECVCVYIRLYNKALWLCVSLSGEGRPSCACTCKEGGQPFSTTHTHTHTHTPPSSPFAHHFHITDTPTHTVTDSHTHTPTHTTTGSICTRRSVPFWLFCIE